MIIRFRSDATVENNGVRASGQHLKLLAHGKEVGRPAGRLECLYVISAPMKSGDAGHQRFLHGALKRLRTYPQRIGSLRREVVRSYGQGRGSAQLLAVDHRNHCTSTRI